MSKYLFVFDLDSTITKAEILPLVAQQVGKYYQMRELTEKTMNGDIPFQQSFKMRVDLLKNTSVKSTKEIISKIPINSLIAEFIMQNSSNCCIISSNLDVWIEGLIKKLGMQNNYFSSTAVVNNDRIVSIKKTVDKGAVVDFFTQPFIAIGDGFNDIPMLKKADIGIAFGGVRKVSDCVEKAADYTINDEKQLCDFLKKFI